MYGSVVPVRARDPTKFQHQGFGMLLMEEAERISLEEHKSTKIAVISGLFIFQMIMNININTSSYNQCYPSKLHQRQVIICLICYELNITYQYIKKCHIIKYIKSCNL